MGKAVQIRLTRVWASVWGFRLVKKRDADAVKLQQQVVECERKQHLTLEWELVGQEPSVLSGGRGQDNCADTWRMNGRQSSVQPSPLMSVCP